MLELLKVTIKDSAQKYSRFAFLKRLKSFPNILNRLFLNETLNFEFQFCSDKGSFGNQASETGGAAIVCRKRMEREGWQHWSQRK